MNIRKLLRKKDPKIIRLEDVRGILEDIGITLEELNLPGVNSTSIDTHPINRYSAWFNRLKIEIIPQEAEKPLEIRVTGSYQFYPNCSYKDSESVWKPGPTSSRSLDYRKKV